ncbi:hypothetical protein SBOR_3320 [Sclerotinia borealis F-4128]|uniref:2EXR domain-containing protein n=1 Tax=Sclerotinia borealis (strain F-4128) TaxID=1432307 RepID=W9CP40_SCLBF|nr:hypothetical protein SBOR_3320 [Sclerotinia borealis F-4128]
MADFNFPGIDLSDPFLPPPASGSIPVSIYTGTPFESISISKSKSKHTTPKLSIQPSHDYGTFTYPLTPTDELPSSNPNPNRISSATRHRDFSSDSHSPPSLSYSRSSSISSSSETSRSSSSSTSTSNLDIVSLSHRSSKNTTTWRPLTSFPHFASLPLEIQKIIWRHTLPGPQIIEIHHHSHNHTPLPLPPTLHTTQLSRHLTLTHLTPLTLFHPYYLPAPPPSSNHLSHLSHPTYIDLSHTTIYISPLTIYPDLGLHMLYTRNLHLIRYLAISFEVWCVLILDNHFVTAMLEMEMEGLVDVEVVFERGVDYSFSDTTSSDLLCDSNVSPSRLQSQTHSNSKNTSNPKPNLSFTTPTPTETQHLQTLFSRSYTRIWRWGYISGWEKILSKICFRWIDEDPEIETDAEIGDAEVEVKIGESESEGGLESLLHSVDDVMMEYRHGYRDGYKNISSKQGRYGNVTSGHGRYGYGYRDADAEQEQVVEYEYSESEYSVDIDDECFSVSVSDVEMEGLGITY